ncbi:cobyrinate a,c-diamide synthase [Desulfovibrio sp. MES5]|uniref:cobyrinate a,c-diamide synthase n=1 Tax=Desulfovibrio sp. MES5 TaxID=1899016 RepID=UPI0025C4814F|nr:cobyrinate a,c-diamide synthase [Desulfovibrio sp. MES5]
MSHQPTSPTFSQHGAMPRLCVTALSGGGGKTLLSLGLCRAFVARGVAVQPFKKGPDYIDAAWLRLAAGVPATNLDPYFLEPSRLCALFAHTMRVAAARQASGSHADSLADSPSMARQGRLLGLLEGNRGFFDGMDARGSCSTAELSRILSCPVIISVDCTKMTRTAAALVRGMLTFEEGVNFAGVILNQVGSARHEKILRQALEEHTDVPVLGALPRLAENPLPERHMGIASCGDDLSPQAQQVLDTLAAFVGGHVDMDRIMAAAQGAPDLEAESFWPESLGSESGHVESGHVEAAAGHAGVLTLDEGATAAKAARPDAAAGATPVAGPQSAAGRRPRIGYVRDAALWFYYEENFEALRRAGAELVHLSLLPRGDDGDAGHGGHGGADWPQVDGLYLGGGFPEDHVEALSASPLLRQLSLWAGQGMPIYAECGGFMVLSRGIEREGKLWPMSGILPVTAVFCPKPQGLGYVHGRITAANPFFALDTELRGHEFHYSHCRWEEPEAMPFGLAKESAGSATESATEAAGEVPPARDGHSWPRWAMQLHKGQGMGPAPGQGSQSSRGRGAPKVDGLVFRNVWASYTHIFAPAAPGWAENFVAAARNFAVRQGSSDHE